MWRVPFLKELLSVRRGEMVVEGFDKDALNKLIEDLYFLRTLCLAEK